MSKFKKINKEDVAAAQAKKKQRKIILRVLGAVVLLAVAVTAVVYFVPKKNGGFGFEQTKTYFEVRGFLKDIIAEDLDSAVEKVWFFDSGENLENGTELSEEEAQNVWVLQDNDFAFCKRKNIYRCRLFDGAAQSARKGAFGVSRRVKSFCIERSLPV